MKTPSDDIRIQVQGTAATQYTGANFTIQASRFDKVGSVAMDRIVEVAKRIREFLAEWTDRAAIDTKGIQVVSKLGLHQNRQSYEYDGYTADYTCTFLCKNIVEGIALHRALTQIDGVTAPSPVFILDDSRHVQKLAFQDAVQKAMERFADQCTALGKKATDHVIVNWGVSEREAAVGKLMSYDPTEEDGGVGLGRAILKLEATFVFRLKE